MLLEEKVSLLSGLQWRTLASATNLVASNASGLYAKKPFPDNHMINGTKLLNVAGMTRGRRDGILKSEKMRHVVKIGPMHLKGVW